MKTQRKLPKKGGAWAVCRFKGGTWQRRRGWCFGGGVYTPNTHYGLCVLLNLSFKEKKTVDCFMVT